TQFPPWHSSSIVGKNRQETNPSRKFLGGGSRTTACRDRLPPRDLFAPNEIVEALPRTSHMGLSPLEQYFSSHGFRIVVGAHHETIGSGTANHQEISHFRGGKRATGDIPAFVLREDIA